MILSHRVSGNPAGIPLIMIHPLGADQSFWDGCRGHFGPSVLTVSFDLRGIGASPDLDEALTLEQSAADIEALRQHLGFGRIVLIGCAVGAMAAAFYAAQYPEHTAGLVMSNPGFRITSEGRANLIQRAQFVRKAGMAALLPQAIENAFIGYGETDARRQYESRFVRQKAENYAFAAIGAADADISMCTARIACPVLLTPGRNDRLFGTPHAAAIMETIAQATSVEFSEGAHFIPYQQPEEFGAVVATFLDQHASRDKEE
jgi:3-oxoadipate enol-lactonase